MFEDRIGQRTNGLKGFWAVLAMAVLLGGCADMGQQQQQPEPDTAAAASPSSDAAGANAASEQPVATAPVTRVVTKTTYVRVRRGDTLQRIAQKHGASVKDLSAWNHLKPNGHLRAGQSIKLVSKQTIAVQAGGAANSAANAAGSREVAAEVARHANSVTLVWPAHGRVVELFAPGATRGIEIAGKAGDPVIAAADGKVMYAGMGLNEYGSLIIVQHNKDFLTAYSHNRRLLVKTGDTVHQGQQIAEMGSENNDRVAVLFEVRRDGKPVDPMPYLPSSPQS
ncbi:peptidoglycan DD-metalloendopeptidase family protein [Paraburkholderia lycopersici]|uniref:Lipoprotein NlpD n=1 Tax=Paraburkholderia lycopersici TaxID=416944 RepID=A0A1G6XH62_9BURK|nr:peptidoglycan DD-metalloendopeptidase family protein [Paraburkholderia lycopersici]SDD77133.1 lipoprotein NlpD [Paraburkholderia lycopersici]